MNLKAFFAVLLVAISLSTFAQNSSTAFTVTGKVVNATDKKPVAGASVFLGNATIGNETGNDGNFILHNVKPGNYTLIVSVIGYNIYTQPLVITNSSVIVPVIEITPGAIDLDEVKIKATTKKNAYSDWAHDTFLKEFFGPSDFASDCKLLNPEALHLKYDESANTITASSTDFLQIENNALGYTIKYRLTDFEYTANEQADKSIHYEGSVFFTEMKGSPAQERQWKQNRDDLYGNSSAHFLRAVLNDQLDEEGFRALRLATVPTPGRASEDVIQANITRLEHSRTHPDSLRYWKKELAKPAMIQQLLPMPLTKADLVTTTDQPGIFALSDHGDPIFLMYDKSRRFTNIKQLSDLNNLNYLIKKSDNKEFTLISFITPLTFFDSNGGIANPNSLEYKGAWVVNRVANLLPIDYEGEAAKSISSEFKNDTVLKTTITALNNYAAAKPTEKVYLHLDRGYYNPGDTIWFKAYDVAGNLHQLSDLSGVLYTELINSKDSVVNRHIIKLMDGLGQGDFDLPITLKPGSYRVRGYTNYMRNAGPDYFYDQRITIGGQQVVAAAAPGRLPAQTTRVQPDIQFFPEGGQLVNGVRSKVAVKCVNSNGLGEDIKGIIVDEKGNEIADFATQHLGMGIFAITPQTGKTYKARIVTADSLHYAVDLPPAQDEGFTLALNYSNADSIYIKVAANDKLFSTQQNAAFYLLAQSGGKVYYTASGKLSTPVFTTTIAKSRFPTGIAQFTLFSQTGIPLSERVIFIKNDDTLKLILSSPSRTYSAQQKVDIAINANNGSLPALGSFSVSVINESRMPVNENAETTILNNLLLTSDLRGYIEQPNYYFINNNNKALADLDLLMLTQGYRRFEWKQVLDTARTTLSYQPETSLSISGSITTSSDKPVPNGGITLIASRENFFTDTTADAKGNFTFSGLSLPDSANLVFRARKQNEGGNVTINIKPANYAAVMKSRVNLDTATALTPGMVNGMADYKARLKQHELINGIRLKEVKVNSSPIHKPDLSYSANLNGPGNADQVIMGDALGNCIDLSDCLNGKIFGVKFRGGNAYNNRNQSRLKLFAGGAPIVPPLAVIIDGLVTDGQGQLDEINPSDIYSIEVLRSVAYSAIYGTAAFSGALIITTKRGNEKKNIVGVAAAGLITYPLKGYYIAKSFYSPQYGRPQNDALKTDDFRSTIYWDADIITDNTGKAFIEFYNADTKGTYRVVIEGIDENGNIGRQVYRYKVE